MVKFIIDFINELLSFVGIKIVHQRGNELMIDFCLLVEHYLMGDLSKTHICFIDGGTYIGSFSKYILKKYGMAKVYAFEPNSACEKKLSRLQKQYPSNFQFYPFALGNEEKKVLFNFNHSPLTNSILNTTNLGMKHFSPLNDRENSSNVSIIRLDTFCAKHSIIPDFVKLDLQGFEERALSGMTGIIKEIKILIIEINFFEYYENGSTFWNINEFLSNENFFLFNIYNYSHSIKNRRLLFGDAIYLKSNIYEKFL